MRGWVVWIALALLVAGCSAEYVEGKIACASDTDCPSAWTCRQREEDGALRCYRAASDAGSTGDSGHDSATDCGGECDDGRFCNGVEICDPSDPNANEDGCAPGTPPDCDDDIACTTDRCDATSNSCANQPPDVDDDGHPDALCVDANGDALGDDCDDDDGDRHPGNIEDCDEQDEDCDPRTFGFTDEDGDGAISDVCCNADATATGGTRCGLDCDDTDLAANTKQPEFCDGIDNDCDDDIDEVMNQVAWYLDSDGDLYGSATDVMMSCMPLAGRSILATDCADTDVSINPARTERCDNVDNNCNGLTDELLDDCATAPDPTMVTLPVNECANSLDDCSPDATCTDTLSAFTCTCPVGYEGDGRGVDGCTDAGECATNNGGCDSDPMARCMNSSGGHTCTCPTGYTTTDDGVTCVPTLLGLTLTEGTLVPAFDAARLAYASNAALTTQTLRITATVPAGATLQIQGMTVASGAQWTSPTLNLNANTITIRVSAGGDHRDYTLTVTRGRQEGYLKASNTGAGDQLGSAVALSADGNTLAVGATLERSAATGIGGDQNDNSASGSGAVYVFTRAGTTWSQQAYIKASNAGASDNFGSSIALSADGNTLTVAAEHEDSAATGVGGDQNDNSASGSGAVYVFTRAGTTWSQQAYVKASNTGSNDSFGISVALTADGNMLAVGAYLEDSSATGIGGSQNSNSAADNGAVYVFTRSGTTWSQQAYVKPSTAAPNNLFGHAVALSSDGTSMAVGAWGEDSAATGIGGNQADDTADDAGAVYVFTRSGSTWSQQAYIKASNTDAGDHFGGAVAMSGDGDTLVATSDLEASAATGIGGNQADDSAIGAGAVYVFTRSGSTWSQQAYIKASNTGAGDNLGHRAALAADGNTLIVGAHGEDSVVTGIGGNQGSNAAIESGAAYVFTRAGATWSQQAYIKASNTGASDQLGYRVAVSGDGRTLAVSAYLEDSVATGVGGNQSDDTALNAGAVYVFR